MHIQEAFDIFGDVGELLEMYDASKRADVDDVEPEQDLDFEGDEAAAEQLQEEKVCLALLSYHHVIFMR